MRLKHILIPENVEVKADKNVVQIKGPKGSIEKTFSKDVDIKVSGTNIEVNASNKALINTVRAIINNMIEGVTKGFEKKLVVRYAHFPVKFVLKGNTLLIENFLGEKEPRKARIPNGVVVKPSGQFVILQSVDKEALGQAAANIKTAVKIRQKDIRVFQDGIYEAYE
ncbi:MAG: 50S ribosomal protein L6 [Candidatus Anstonellales archaeon]